MGKIEEATKKINTEIQKDPDNEYIAWIGEHVIDCITTEEAAEAVLREDKTLNTILKEIKDELRKIAEQKYRSGKAEGNCVGIGLSDDTVFPRVRKYFGLTDVPEAAVAVAKTQTIAEPPKEEPKKGLQRLSLDDF